MIKGNYFSEQPELTQYFNSLIDWEKIVPLKERNFADAEEYKKTGNEALEYAPSNVAEAIEFYRSVLETVGDISGNHLAEHAGAIELEGLKLEDGKVIFPKKMEEIVDMFVDAGIAATAVGRKYGGLDLPVTATCLFTEIVSRSCSAMGIAAGGFNLAEFIEKYADDQAMKDELVTKMAHGEFTGAMALTEPDYGSNLPELKTKAVKDENGQWRISGTKIFITHGCGMGDREAIILTLARSGESKGAKGLSFFAVKSSDVEVVRIEEKMGLHSSPTCQIAFDNSPAQLIGKEGLGLVKYSMAMMNGARMAVAAQAVGISQAALAEAKHYASVRVQFGKNIEDIPAVRLLIDQMESETAAMRSLLYEAAHMVDMSQNMEWKLGQEGLNEREIRKHPDNQYYDKLAKILTPLSKFYASEKSNDVAYNGLQVYGGHGYTHEYDVARIYADARITAIYEGTSQLQVVAAIGGIVEGLASNGIFAKYVEKLLADTGHAQGELGDAYRTLVDLVKRFKTLPKEAKDYNAWYVVSGAVGLLNTLLLYRDGAKLKDPAFSEIAERYAVDYLANFAGDVRRLENAFAKAAPELKAV